MKRFSLMLDDAVYEDFYRFYGQYGLRQAILRKCVTILVERAKGRLGEGQRPWWWGTEHESTSLEQAISSVADAQVRRNDDG